jgi:CubicO group peptidase (beta-lactamase class C family)
VTLEHLLAMKSGLAWRDHDLPWGDKARVYYDPRLRALALSRPLAGPPGERFEYNSYNPVLLGLALERATGLSPAAYLETRLWQPLGMAFPASWSVASAADGLPKMESGINARAIDFARLAQLVLDRGQADGQQLISADWLAASTRVDPASRIPDFGEGMYYQYGWWLYARGDGTPPVISASGHLGQYLYIFPESETVMVRFGKRVGRVDSWRAVGRALLEQLTQEPLHDD